MNTLYRIRNLAQSLDPTVFNMMHLHQDRRHVQEERSQKIIRLYCLYGTVFILISEHQAPLEHSDCHLEYNKCNTKLIN